jgi:predicted nucleic acid-binding Zn ribbon protein
MMYTTYYCRECGERKGVEYPGPQEPIVKCPICKVYMHRVFPNWLSKIKKYKETVL